MGENVKAGFFTVALMVLGVSQGFAKPLTPLSPTERQSRAATLAHSAWNGKSTKSALTEEDGCLMRTEKIQVDDPVSKTSRPYELLVQAPKVAKQVPVVIIVPTIRGTQEYLEPEVARSLCAAGIGSIIADVNDFRQPATYPSWGGEDLNNRRALLALQTVVDFAQAIPQFDPQRVGAMGLSLGGITTALWAGIDPRLKASVIVVGGGNFPYILAQSDEPNVEELRDKRMAAAGLKTADQYEDVLRGNVQLDPFYFAPGANRGRIMMVMAESDTKVPYVVQREQFMAFGQPQSETFTGGHVATIVEMVYLYMDDVTSFFNDRFSKALSLSEPTITHKTVDLDKLGY